jgi:hypothetical protein
LLGKDKVKGKGKGKGKGKEKEEDAGEGETEDRVIQVHTRLERGAEMRLLSTVMRAVVAGTFTWHVAFDHVRMWTEEERLQVLERVSMLGIDEIEVGLLWSLFHLYDAAGLVALRVADGTGPLGSQTRALWAAMVPRVGQSVHALGRTAVTSRGRANMQGCVGDGRMVGVLAYLAAVARPQGVLLRYLDRLSPPPLVHCARNTNDGTLGFLVARPESAGKLTVAPNGRITPNDDTLKDMVADLFAPAYADWPYCDHAIAAASPTAYVGSTMGIADDDAEHAQDEDLEYVVAVGADARSVELGEAAQGEWWCKFSPCGQAAFVVLDGGPRGFRAVLLRFRNTGVVVANTFARDTHWTPHLNFAAKHVAIGPDWCVTLDDSRAVVLLPFTRGHPRQVTKFHDDTFVPSSVALAGTCAAVLGTTGEARRRLVVGFFDVAAAASAASAMSAATTRNRGGGAGGRVVEMRHQVFASPGHDSKVNKIRSDVLHFTPNGEWLVGTAAGSHDRSYHLWKCRVNTTTLQCGVIEAVFHEPVGGSCREADTIPCEDMVSDILFVTNTAIGCAASTDVARGVVIMGLDGQDLRVVDRPAASTSFRLNSEAYEFYKDKTNLFPRFGLLAHGAQSVFFRE